MPTPEFYDTAPPARRVDTGLGAIQLEIVHGEGVLRLDPNTAVMMAHRRTLELGAPVARSVLSREPGYIYRSAEMQLVFTEDELYRFLRHALEPAEYKKLFLAFGDFYEIHDDFYDPSTGESL